MFSIQPIVPKNPDGVARIISVGRLSQPKETEAETQQSLEAIRRENERMLKSIYSGPATVKYLAEQVSGMLAIRQTMTELWDLVASGEWDAIIAEDLSRIFRNPRFQLAFLQDCYDAGIRVICFADNLDTADENWESSALIATVRHGLAIPDGRRRIKRTASESFKRGGMVMKVKAFFAKVSREDAATGKYGPKGLRIRRLVEYASVVAEICRRLLAGESPQSIVAWLNAENVPCGEYVGSKKWTFKVFRDLVRDPILHGTRTFRDVVHKQIMGTGLYRREKNPTPEVDYVPELAFMTRDEQEQMLAAVGWTIDWGGKAPSQEPHPRKGIPRYQSFWPAQSSTCNACGGMMYAYGGYLRCCNSLPHLGGTCWNHCRVPVAPLRTAFVKWIVEQCNNSTSFLDVVLDAAQRFLSHQQSRRSVQRDALAAQIKDLEGQEGNLRRSIRVAAEIADEDLKAVVADLAAVTRQLKDVRIQAECAEGLPASVTDYEADDILANLAEVLEHLLATSFEMAEVARDFVPRCVIVPVQSLDTGQVYPRAKLLVRGSMENYDQLDELVVDAFEPTVYVRIMPEVVKLRAQEPRPTLKQIGATVGANYMTVKRALAYHRSMQDLGVSEPYRELTEKPQNASRWRDAS